MRTVSKSATFLATESVNSAPIKRGETEVQIFWQGKAQNSSPILRCTFLARRSAKLIANFSATMVTSLPSFSLCIFLSLSPNVPHAQYRKRFRVSHSTQILQVTSRKHLGIHFSDTLSCQRVIDKVYTSCASRVGMIRRLRWRFLPAVLKNIFIGAVQPKL